MDSEHKAKADGDAEPPGEGDIRQLAEELADRWRDGERADVEAFLRRYPAAWHYKSVVVDLAFEEYLQRVSGGESLDLKRFCGRFRPHQASLRRRLAMHYLVDEDTREGLPEELALAWPQPGEQLFEFVILGELGAGGFARVYLARQPDVGNRSVVLKVGPDSRQEAQMLGRLEHPNIVPVYSVHRDETTRLSAICMPYVGRATLDDVLRLVGSSRRSADELTLTVFRLNRLRLSELGGAGADADADVGAAGDAGEADASQGQDDSQRSMAGWVSPQSYVEAILRLAVGICSGLAYTHRAGVLHLDLKPGNILITNEGQPLLLDFNLAWDQAGGEATPGGTLPYMSPEQLRRFLGEAETPLDRRSDLFSLGVILFQLFNGRLPFPLSSGRSVEAIAQELLKAQERGRVAWTSDQAGFEVRRLVDSCLRVDPAQRPDSAGELLEALSHQRAWHNRLGRRLAARPWLLPAAALVLAIAAVAGSLVHVWAPPTHQRRLVRAQRAVAEQRLDDAIAELDLALREHPSFVEALLERSRLYYHFGDYPSAMRDMRRAYETTKNPEYLAVMGYYLCQENRFAAAHDHFRDAMMQGVDDLPTANNLAVALYAIAHFELACETLRRGVESHGPTPVALKNLAMCELSLALHTREFPSRAMVAIDQVVKPGTDSRTAKYHAAAIYSLAASKDLSYMEAAREHLETLLRHGYSHDSAARHPQMSFVYHQYPELATVGTRRRLKADTLGLFIRPKLLDVTRLVPEVGR